VSIAIISGSAGLIGSEASAFFANQGFDVVGIDNDMRSYFFGAEASTSWNRQRLEKSLGGKYHHVTADIRDYEAITQVFKQYGSDIELVIHTAAQPSHDWAAREPKTDFTVNANGTLNMLEANANMRQKPFLSLPQPTRCTGIRPIACLWWNWNIAGKSSPVTPMNRASEKICRLTARCTAYLGHPRWRRTFWYRNTGAILGLRVGAFAAGA
jgi:nucleoside-diphosphate-sugar epimerase